MRTTGLAVFLLLVSSAPAAAKAICADGRFELQARTGRHGVPASATLTLSRADVSVEGLCPPVTARRGHAGEHLWLPWVRVKWPTCVAASGIVGLRARMTYPDCATMRGVFRTRRGRVRFTGTRVPVCGNGAVEQGEDCDDGNTDAGDCCTDCRVEPGCFSPCTTSAECAATQVCQRQSCGQATGVCGYPPTYACDTDTCDASGGRPESFCERDGAARYCGCDGQHYASVCDAWAAGTHVTSCYESCRQDGFVACPAGTLCDVDARIYPGCPGTETWGRCVALPASCAAEPDAPVCGCNGVVYPNDCARVRAGQPVTSDTRCGP